MISVKLREFAIRFAKLFVLAILISGMIIVTFQEFLIFPMLVMGYRPTVPQGVVSEVRAMQAGNSLEVWSMEPNPEGPLFSDHAVGVFFCGNGGGLEGQSYPSMLFASWGVKTYLVDFPGYGNSTGWPSEELLYNNALEVAANTLARERIDSSKLIIGGVSMGTGLASYLAKEMHPRVLVLYAGYADFRELIREKNLFFWLLSPFLRFSLPTVDNVAALNYSSVIAAHGSEDETIPPKHLDEIAASYKGAGQFVRILVPGVTHNHIVADSETQVYRALMEIWPKAAHSSSLPCGGCGAQL